MKELYRTANPVQISVMQAFLREHDIETLVLGADVSALYPGIEGLQSRLMVLDDDVYERALALLHEEGLI